MDGMIMLFSSENQGEYVVIFEGVPSDEAVAEVTDEGYVVSQRLILEGGDVVPWPTGRALRDC